MKLWPHPTRKDPEDPSKPLLIEVPNGIDPGWAYNPGAAKWGEIEAGRLIDDGYGWKDVDPWGPIDYERLRKPVTDAPIAEIGEKVSAEKLRQAFHDAVGGDEVTFADPLGEEVVVTQGIVNHMLEDPKRINGREMYFPFIPELIKDPYEIWLNFEQNDDSGRIRLRKRYVKGLDIGKGKTVTLIAEEQNGLWVDFTFLKGDLSGLANVRKGRLLYGR